MGGVMKALKVAITLQHKDVLNNTAPGEIIPTIKHSLFWRPLASSSVTTSI
jgi:hypothetical protein